MNVLTRVIREEMARKAYILLRKSGTFPPCSRLLDRAPVDHVTLVTSHVNNNKIFDSSDSWFDVRFCFVSCQTSFLTGD